MSKFPYIVLLFLISIISVCAITQHPIYSPSKEIETNQILIYDNYTLINQSGIVGISITNTGSMLPLMNSESKALGINTNSVSLNVGDIVTYNSSGGKYIIHRITDIKNGLYTLKGDNNLLRDIEKVRIEQIEYKIIGVIY